ncbi:MAG: pantoate--beta-alanine ligase [Pseudomonadota bacterium]
MKKNPLMVVRSKAELSALISNERCSGHRVGFVPTMGALHNGHLSLVALSREYCSRTVASIFVNPTQFAPGEDFDSYPRREDEDLEKLREAGCDFVYLPSPEDIYPTGHVTNVRVDALSDRLDGQFRPHFFYGVTTVVARLFIHVAPDLAVFGQKDFQQLQIIRKMVRDLGFPIEIIGAPTVRDQDGLAQSSRNEYLSQDERRRASAIQTGLYRAKKRLLMGADLNTCIQEARTLIASAGFDRIDYVSAVRNDDLVDLDPSEPIPEHSRLLAAAWLGKTRLIDNIALTGAA